MKKFKQVRAGNRVTISLDTDDPVNKMAWSGTDRDQAICETVENTREIKEKVE